MSLLAASPTGDAASFHTAYLQQWDAAADYAASHRDAWSTIWETFGIDRQMAEAIVFPEMVRYNLLQDRMETMAVKGTYISRGTKGFDFSIGRFQMKPSFVEKLEKRWMKSAFPKQYDAYFDTDDTQFARRARIERIADELWQCVYLAMFVKLLCLDYGIDTLPEDERLSVASAAYNRGCEWPGAGKGQMEDISKFVSTPHFHIAVVPTPSTCRYVYSEIASMYFESLKGRE